MSASLDTSTPLNDQLTQSVLLDDISVGAGQRVAMANGGYFGVPVVPGQVYRVSFFAKASGGFAGSIVAALFLNRFVTAAKSWLHIDVYAWTPAAKPGRPEGGECQAARALYALLVERYG